MDVGVILRVTESGRIIKRTPIWPWPKPGLYPQSLPDGIQLLFFPKPYYNFPLNGVIHEHRNQNESVEE